MKCCNCPCESEVGMYCRICNQTANVMMRIHHYWKADELEDLRTSMRSKTVDQHIKDCPAGAWMSRGLYTLIKRLAYPAGCDADRLKMKVEDAITKYLGAMEGVRAHEREHGEGSWMRSWTAAVNGHIKSALS